MDTVSPLTIEPASKRSISAPKQQQTNGAKKPTGFQLHPEHINRTGLNRKEWTFKGLIEEQLEEDIELKNKLGLPTSKIKRKQAVVRKLLQMALSGEGNLQAIKEILDRTDGKVTQKVDHTSLGEKMEAPILYIPEEKNE